MTCLLLPPPLAFLAGGSSYDSMHGYGGGSGVLLRPCSEEMFGTNSVRSNIPSQLSPQTYSLKELMHEGHPQLPGQVLGWFGQGCSMVLESKLEGLGGAPQQAPCSATFGLNREAS